ncbi:MAG: cell division protein ZapA [Proteobacteria bacterium]|nr:cell division protein ZapA [Pseudomonadota bacterium]
MTATVRILGEDFRLECSAGDRRRIEDLAKALAARLGESGETTELRKLILAALSLMDESQTTGAALARARGEIERLNDMVAEARIEAAEGVCVPQDQGRVKALRTGTA